MRTDSSKKSMNFIEKKEQRWFSRKSSTRRTKEAIWKKSSF